MDIEENQLPLINDMKLLRIKNKATSRYKLLIFKLGKGMLWRNKSQVFAGVGAVLDA